MHVLPQSPVAVNIICKYAGFHSVFLLCEMDGIDGKTLHSQSVHSCIGSKLFNTELNAQLCLYKTFLFLYLLLYLVISVNYLNYSALVTCSYSPHKAYRYVYQPSRSTLCQTAVVHSALAIQHHQMASILFFPFSVISVYTYSFNCFVHLVQYVFTCDAFVA